MALPVLNELNSFGVDVYVYDPLVNKDECKESYDVSLVSYDEIPKVDAILCSIGHDIFLKRPLKEWFSLLSGDPIFLDVKGIFKNQVDRSKCLYWSL